MSEPQPHQLFRGAVAEFGDRLSAVPADAWEAPTPCTEWTVRDLTAHVVEEELWVPPLLAGEPADEIGDRIAGDVLGSDPVQAWKQAAERAREATTGDAVLSATVRLPSGEVNAADYLYEMFADHLIHTWDLARAIGASEKLDPELVAACAAWFDGVEDKWRAAGVIGSPVAMPADADDTMALVARFGRDPR